MQDAESHKIKNRKKKKLHTENYSIKLLLISIFFFPILQLEMTNVAVESADSIKQRDIGDKCILRKNVMMQVEVFL